MIALIVLGSDGIKRNSSWMEDKRACNGLF